MTVHSVLWRSRGAGPAGKVATGLAINLAENTGGRYTQIAAATAFEENLRQLAADMAAHHEQASIRYRVIYERPDPPGQLVSVSVTRPGVDLQLFGDRRRATTAPTMAPAWSSIARVEAGFELSESRLDRAILNPGQVALTPVGGAGHPTHVSASPRQAISIPAPPRHATATPRPRPAVIQARGLTADECAAILATCMQRRRTGRGLERTETAERRASESASPGSRRAGMVRMIEKTWSRSAGERPAVGELVGVRQGGGSIGLAGGDHE